MLINTQIRKQVRLIVPEDWNNDQKGEFFENLLADLFSNLGFTIEKRVRFTGMEIDVIAKHDLLRGERVFIEAKFLNENKPFPSDVVSKLYGNASIKKASTAFLISTSSPNKEAKGILDELDEISKLEPSKKPILEFINSEKLAEWFTKIKDIKEPNIENLDEVKVITLLITHKQFLWVVEQISQGEPFRAIIFNISNKDRVDLDELKAEFSRLNLWQGVDIIHESQINNKSKASTNLVPEIDKEPISGIGEAESFDHYQRPCRPQDFVGRISLREEFGKFLENVRDGRTSTRIVCFSGQSGFGKSSLVLRIGADYSQNPKYNNSFYIYNIDVRSAKGILFVVTAIRTAIQQAIKDNFIEIPDHKISIESIEQPFFSSPTIQLALEKLKETRRVLVIFFDQFEVILTKESLFGVYELFEKLAHEIDALKENIVLGFCWRTGIIGMLDDHKAHRLWHKLEDKRQEFKLKDFNLEESRNLLNQFDEYLVKQGKPLEQKLKQWLLENCPPFPWLLRKICSDISNKVVNEQEIISRHKLDIKDLFDKDLEIFTTKEQHDCLRYIAKESPVKLHEVTEKFAHEVVKSIEDARLIIRTGMSYTIYWDIFREYVMEEKLPVIPDCYRIRNRINSTLEIFKIVANEERHEITLSVLLNKSTFKRETINSILGDLQNFSLLDRERDIIKVAPGLVNAGDYEIANYLAKHLEEHIVTREIYATVKPGNLITLWGFQNIIAQAYFINESNKRTIKDYASRILSWFLFTGLLEKQTNNLILRPVNEGKQKGKLVAHVKVETDLPLLKLLS